MKEMKEQEERSLVASEAETITSCYGVLAGLTFTASILIFSLYTNILYGDAFLTLSLISAILFIFSVALSSSASSSVRKFSIKEAKKLLDRADNFAVVAFLLMMSELALIAFYTGWQHGVAVVVVIILSFIYLIK